MKRITLILTTLLFTSSYLFCQTEGAHIYNPEADAKADIAAAIKQASAENKHVLLQIGGNWCPWCIKLDGLMAETPKVDSLLKADYVRVMINYSKENKNEEVMHILGNPNRFGFPVLVVLNENGSRIHTQDSWYLEKDKSYDIEKLTHFLEMWNVAAAGK
jgi:thioredoxin-related protein